MLFEIQQRVVRFGLIVNSKFDSTQPSNLELCQEYCPNNEDINCFLKRPFLSVRSSVIGPKVVNQQSTGVSALCQKWPALSGRSDQPVVVNLAYRTDR